MTTTARTTTDMSCWASRPHAKSPVTRGQPALMVLVVVVGVVVVVAAAAAVMVVVVMMMMIPMVGR